MGPIQAVIRCSVPNAKNLRIALTADDATAVVIANQPRTDRRTIAVRNVEVDLIGHDELVTNGIVRNRWAGNTTLCQSARTLPNNDVNIITSAIL